MKIIDSKRSKGLCVAYRCGASTKGTERFCAKHRKRYQKENNPIMYVYGYLKQNARRRGKAFDLTLPEFGKFCQETGYLDGRGKLKKSLTIDRIDPTKGYSIDNIQVLSLSDNSRKGDKVEDCPF